jgi:two-component system cell cycle response regulator DivK
MAQKDSEVGEPNKSQPENQPDSPQEIVKTSPEETKAGPDNSTTSPEVKTKPTVVKAPPEAVTGSDTARVPRLPQDEKEAPAADNGKEKTEPGFDSVDPSEAHVLVVEDNVPNFVLIARMLAYMGVQRCEWKTSGWQVVEFADTLPRIDLILMDIRLPYEDGFQALEKVRSNPRLKDTLVVAVTAEASVEQMRRAKEAGFNGFLGKPLDPDRFPDQVRRVLSGEPVWEIH